jgi:hypothetical protein
MGLSRVHIWLWEHGDGCTVVISILLEIIFEVHDAMVRMAYQPLPTLKLTSSCSMSKAVDTSTAVCFDLSCGGAAFGKFCPKDVNKRSSGMVSHSLVPPVEELLGTRGSTLEVIDNKPVKGFVVEPIWTRHHREAVWSAKRTNDNIAISSVWTHLEERT